MDVEWVRTRFAALAELGDRQWREEHETIDLIASDNAFPLASAPSPPYVGHAIQEGLVDRRPFAGARTHDDIERLAAAIACDVFGAEHANLQPHSCSQANQAVYHALLRPGDAVCALDFRAGGHLTHGLKINFSGRTYRFHHYGLGADERIDYEAAQRLAGDVRPKLIVCGSSSYPRLFQAERLRAIADSVGARLMFDLSHEAGLIAGAAVPNPVAVADVVTMSLDKTLRGPFGAMVLCRAELAERIDRAVHPGVQSSFPIRRLVDSAHALLLTQTTSFREYARAAVANSRLLGSQLLEAGVRLATGGTDKHYTVADTATAFRLSGVQAEGRLERVGILANRQSLPWDLSPRINECSGIRLGTAWATSRGYTAGDFVELACIIVDALRSATPEAELGLRRRVSELVGLDRPGDVWRTREGAPAHRGLCHA
jgi:glycine hydroxymethyltransferase